MKIVQLLAFIVLLFSANGLADVSSDHSHQTREQVAWQQIKEGALLIDSRTAQEFAIGHIIGAINIPFDVSVKKFTALNVAKDRKVVLYCRSGNRSGKAIKRLKKAGYLNLHNGGGFKDLSAAKK